MLPWIRDQERHEQELGELWWGAAPASPESYIMPRSPCLWCWCPQCLALQQVLLLDKTSQEPTSIPFTSLTVMELYRLQISTTAHLFALYNSSYYLQYPFSYGRLQMSTLCFWCQVENTMDCSLTFNIPKIIPEILTFLWWRTLRRLQSEALKSLTWDLHPHLCPSACSLGLQGRTGKRPLPCLPGHAIVLCSWLLVPGMATGPCFSLTSG